MRGFMIVQLNIIKGRTCDLSQSVQMVMIVPNLLVPASTLLALQCVVFTEKNCNSEKPQSQRKQHIVDRSWRKLRLMKVNR